MVYLVFRFQLATVAAREIRVDELLELLLEQRGNR